MGESWRIFQVLLKKNFLIRMRYGKNNTFLFLCQLLIPIFIFFMGIYLVKNIHSLTKTDNESSYNIHNKHKLITNISYFLLHYTPKNNFTEKLIDQSLDCLQINQSEYINAVANKNEKEIDASFQQLDLNSSYNYLSNHYIGLVFDNSFASQKILKYKLKITELPDHLHDYHYENINSWFNEQSRKKLTALQLCLDESYIKMVAPKSHYKLKISLGEIPYNNNLPLQTLNDITIIIVSLLTFTSFLIIAMIEVSYLANEKNSGMSFIMFINGAKYHLNLLSWFLSAVLFSFIRIIPMLLIMKYFKISSTNSFVSHGNIIIVGIVLTTHICHTLAYGYQFILSLFIEKTSYAILLLMLISSVKIIIHLTLKLLKYDQTMFLYLGIIFPNIYWNFVIEKIITHETGYISSSEFGISWKNMFIDKETQSFSIESLGGLAFLSVIGTIWNLLSAIYMQNIRPGKYGTPKNPFFFLKRKKKMENFPTEVKTNQKEFQHFPDDFHPEIEVRGVKKVYSNFFSKSKVHALKGISINIFRNKITLLLGSNGAGKSTLLSVLCGLTGMTEGNVIINEENIVDDSSVIRRNINFCPQGNIAFPNLTLQEQLVFFGSLRSVKKTKEELKKEINVLLEKLNLSNEGESLPNELSGGQQRLLSIAISIVGDRRIIILDEPTVGLDLKAKRDIWDVLMNFKNEKTMIIITHNMEEAELLADTIAIMNMGELKCYGTPMFLKKLYGNNQVYINLSVKSTCQPASVYREIGFAVNVVRQENNKLIVAVPNNDDLPKSLDKLEIKKNQLGIIGISASLISIEQLFFKALDLDNNNLGLIVQKIKHEKNTKGFKYLLNIFVTYLNHKMKFSLRNIPIFLWSIFSISIAVIPISYLIFNLKNTSISLSPLLMNLSIYPNSNSFIYSNNDTIVNHYKYFVKNYESVDLHDKLTTNFLFDYVRKNNSSGMRNVIISSIFNQTHETIDAHSYYLNNAKYSVPIAINCLSNVLIKTLTGDDEYKIETFVQSFPSQLSLYNFRKLKYTYINYLTWILLILTLSLVPIFYVIQPFLEKKSGIRQLQNMTSAPPIVYWITTYLFDLLRFIISTCVLAGLLVLIDYFANTNIFKAAEIVTFMTLFTLFGMSVLPFIYACSFINKSENFVKSIVGGLPILFYSFHLVLNYSKSLVNKSWFDGILMIETPVLYFFCPHVNFFDVYFEYFKEITTDRNIQSAEITIRKYYFNLIRDSCLFFIGSTTFYCLLVLILENKYFERIFQRSRKDIKDSKNNIEPDTTVQREKYLIMEEIEKQEKSNYMKSNVESKNTLLAYNLTKIFGPFKAVDGISFRLKKGEHLGLFGVRGTGITTTFKMLTGELTPDTGKIYLNKYNIINNRKDYLSEIGYCPQQHTLIDSMNSYDHLYLFGRLRGIPSDEIDNVVHQWIKKLDLTQFASQPSKSYSGGNKRRLNIGIALIGYPSVVMMDVPTAGVDLVARKSICDILKNCVIAGQSIICTVDDIKDCETLYNRLVIMVKGKIIGVGTSEELKQHFHVGYTLHIKISPIANSSWDLSFVKIFIEKRLQCQLIDESLGFIAYHVTDPSATWRNMYALMKEVKDLYNSVQDFTILSSTVEQLFIQLARLPNNNYANFISIPDNSIYNSPGHKLDFTSLLKLTADKVK